MQAGFVEEFIFVFGHWLDDPVNQAGSGLGKRGADISDVLAGF
jgi:hypothetical protein